MDLMEQIRLDAKKDQDENWQYIEYEGWQGDPIETFEHGAQALLNLLGRSATSEGHPPRVWIHTLDRKSVVPVHALIHFDPEHEHHEYLSRQEHEALRAADLLEVERLKSQAAIAFEEIGKLRNMVLDGAQELSAEREARKGDSAELEKIREDLDHENWRLEKALKVRWNDLVAEREKNARLTAALEKIVLGGDPCEIGSRASRQDMVAWAKEALREAPKNSS